MTIMTVFTVHVAVLLFNADNSTTITTALGGCYRRLSCYNTDAIS